MPRQTRLHGNVRTKRTRLRWFDGTAREVITTPGHHFLDEFGGFPTTPEMTRTGSATVVLASGKWIAAKTAGWVRGAEEGEGVLGHGSGGVMGRGV